MKFAVFSVSVPEYTPEIAVQKLKEFGYDGIEWRVIDEDPATAKQGFWGGNKATLPFSTLAERAPEYRALTEAAGIEVPSLGTYVGSDDLDGVNRAMEAAIAMGVRQLRIRSSQYNGLDPFMPIWERSKAQYKDVAGLARKHGVRALIELHHRSITPSASSGRLFLDGLDPALVGVIHDAGNMVHEGYETHRMSLEMLGPYLAHVHVKNARWFPTKYAEDGTLEWKCDWAPVHRGVVDMRALFTALHAIGYDGWVGLEDFSTDRKIDDRLPENLQYLKSVMQSVATGS